VAKYREIVRLAHNCSGVTTTTRTKTLMCGVMVVEYCVAWGLVKVSERQEHGTINDAW
jgi:hypothetical protein